MTQSGLSVQRACRAVGLSRATYYRPLVDWARRDAPVIAALTTLVAVKSRWGFWKCCDRLRLDGYPWNPKRLWRVYCQLRLNLPRRTKKRLPVRLRQPLDVVPQPNSTWAVDFMSDTLYGGRRFRTLNILDEGVREALAIEVDTSLPAERVSRVLEQVVAWRGRPQAIPLDNGPELIADRFMTCVCGARDRTVVHPAGKAGSECVHRTIQPHLSHGSPQCLRIRVAGAGPGDHCGMAPELQRRAAP